ncbi:MAG: hypothetical protein R6V73_03025, partial [Anaerolineales bacterium]
DECGGVVGIVTLADLLGEIIGEIRDEYDDDPDDYRVIDDHEVILKGSMPVNDLNRLYDLNIETEDAGPLWMALWVLLSGRFVNAVNNNETIKLA